MSRHKHLRRGVLVAVALATSAGSLVLGAGIAGASNAQVTAVGSDTTFNMVGQLFPSSVNNISAIPLTGTNTATIASDPFTCAGGVTYSSGSLAPNGSGAGKNALFAEESAPANEQGCIDFARSSSAPEPHTLSVTYTTGDPTGSNFDYYAYALDGVAPLVGSNSGSTVAAPITLGLFQMKYIYSCGGSAGATGAHTTWAAASIGKSTDNIHRFWPQNGSGTLAVLRDALGFDPTVLSGVNHCTTLPIQGFSLGANSTVNEENTEDGIVYANSLPHSTAANCDVAGTSSGYCNIADDVYIYSAGKLS
jgi:ABC-type phosphate transport system substrate-binding protein